MPALPKKKLRRPTPTTNSLLHQENVWQRTLDSMRLGPLSSSEDIKSTDLPLTTSDLDLSMAGLAERKSERKPTLFLDLPLESQQEICGNVSSADLISLSLVSKHFRDLAAKQLYKSFHIVFPDEGDPSGDSPIDSLAQGLETFTTSEYDYAQHLRELVLEAVSGEERGERAYKTYQYDTSCGKFMNTLLLLTLRKAKCLETFRWDIRVELSRQVFNVLHGIAALKNLHLRMQVGHSIFLPAPAIPASVILSAGAAISVDVPSHVPHPNTAYGPAPTQLLIPSIPHSGISSHTSRIVRSHRANFRKPVYPPTLSLFKDLNSLAVLDMDTLDYISELHTCIKNCASTLSSLKLSFSESLANKKSHHPPPAIVHSSDEEEESDDEFGQTVPTTPTSAWPDSTAEQRVREKEAQEGALARIFNGPQPQRLQITRKSASTKLDRETSIKTESALRERKDWMANLGTIVADLVITTKPGHESVQQPGEDTLASEIMKRVAQICCAADEKPTNIDERSSKNKSESTNASGPPGGEQDEGGSSRAEPAGGEHGTAGEVESLEASSSRKSIMNGVCDPDDIDVDKPDMADLDILTEATGDDGKDEHPPAYQEDTASEREPAKEKKIFGELDGKIASTASPGEAESAMSEYVRSTRGLTLANLAIYLIPLRIKVIFSAIDITVLRSITLLNVGPQAEFWATLAKVNKQHGFTLPLNKVHTDNVTTSLLVCVRELSKLTELYLLEQSLKSRVERTCGKTSVTIEDIRKVVLKKHVSTLRNLVIRNNATTAWDLDSKTVLLLTHRAKALEELAISFGVETMHCLLQNMAGLASLRALHTIHFRTDDTCVWVMREFRKFAVDNASHNPNLKLEYLALDNNIQRLVRRQLPVPTKPSVEKKRKERAPTDLKSMREFLGKNHAEDAWLVAGMADESDSEEESWGSRGLKLESIEGLKFCDVSGVRIFDKEILYGKL